MTPTMIHLERVSRSFGAVRAVAAASLEVGRGEFVALLGPSGCGKTTLLRLIAGFEAPDDGPVRLGEQVVAGGGWVPPERRHVGMVFQDYALFPHLSVARNVGYGLPRRGRDRRVGEALELVGLAGHGYRFPHELSGGQQQRVALARALAPEPSVVLLDEPWSNIDPVLRGAMRDDLAAILRATGVTVLLVTHEQEEAFSLADRVALMRDGSIVQTGSPEEIYYGPATRRGTWTCSCGPSCSSSPSTRTGRARSCVASSAGTTSSTASASPTGRRCAPSVRPTRRSRSARGSPCARTRAVSPSSTSTARPELERTLQLLNEVGFTT